MNTVHTLSSLLFWTVVYSLLVGSVSVPVWSGQDFSQHVELSKSLSKKLLSQIPTVHQSCISSQGLSLDSSSEVKNLEYMMVVLDIPAAPALIPLSDTHTLEVSLGQMTAGLQLHQHLLQEVEQKLSCSAHVSALLADLRDLSAQVHQVQQLAHFSSSEPQVWSWSLSSRLSSDYEVQVAAHLILQQLRSFTQDLYRGLRHISVTKTLA